MELPDEIKDRIVDFLYDRHDYHALALVSQSWSRCALRRLYESIELAVPHDVKDLKPLESVISSSAFDFVTTTSLSILPRCGGPRNIYRTLDTPHDALFTRTKPGKVDQIAYQDPLNMLTRLLLGRLPKNSLRSFNWTHEFSIEAATAQKLLKDHSRSLQHLQLRDRNVINKEWKKPFLMVGLRTLSISCLAASITGARLVAKNSSTLQELEIGLETAALNAYLRDTIHEEVVDSNLTLTFCRLLPDYSDPAEVSVAYLKLRKLKVIGMDTRLLFGGPFRPLTDLSVLMTLTLESCHGLYNSFRSLANKTGSESINRLPRLCSLTIRQERVDHYYPTDSIASFLYSMSPLTTLHVLLSGISNYQRLKGILKVHGRSLKSLIWDQRFGRRYCMQDDRLIENKNQSLERLRNIADFRPHLVELGIPVTWNYASGLSEDGLETSYGRYLKKMKDLKTLNIRNLPRMTPDAFVRSDWLPSYWKFQALASMIVDDVMESNICEAGRLPKLSVIGLGALTYCDVWDGNLAQRQTDLDDYLRLRIFAADYAKTRIGKTQPLLSPLACGYAGGIGREISENTSIFERY